jgi:DNA-binding NarL/FixJ family response regulator
MLTHRGRHDIVLGGDPCWPGMRRPRLTIRASPDVRASSDGASSPVMTKTVLIVDDHEDFRAAARALLEADGFHVVGEAADGAEAIRMAAQLRPAVVLLDIALPDLDGFAVAQRLAELDPSPAVVLISSRERAVYGRRIDRAAVCGFLSKGHLSGAAITALTT